MTRTAAIVLALTLLSPSLAPARDRVLHEYVPPPGETSAPLPKPGELPDSIRTEDRTLPRPDQSTDAAPGERTLGENAKLDRSTGFQVDRSTRREGVLHYNAEFEPEVVPFKRMSSFDAVAPGYRLVVRAPSLRAEPLAAGVTPPDRDAFWGSLLVSVRAGQPVPIPSVAPEARILGVRATPMARFRFYRDSADNFWVSTDASGNFRLVFLTDAPRHYFSAQIPPTVTTADVPARLQPSLPPEVQRAAEIVLRRLELRTGGNTLLRQLDRLVAYFRAFVPGDLPSSNRGNTYLDVALSQRGVCRHRSFAFVITAQALGIPARFVHNEAHAFTEVFVPRLGWVRIDLGGASDELQVHNGRERAIHDPGPDPFPKPSSFRNGTDQRGIRVSGLSPERRLHRRSAGVNLRAYDRTSVEANPTVASTSPTPPSPARRATTSQKADGDDGGDGGDGGDDNGADTREAPSKRPTEIVLFSPNRIIYRGDQIRVWGRVTSQGSGVNRLPVEIYLSRDGKTAEVSLGTLVSGPDGLFRSSMVVPRGVPVGDYQVYAATAGDARHHSALSR